MATINASKWGFCQVANQSTHAAARGATAASVISNPTTQSSNPIMYLKGAGRSRGSFVYRVNRTFYYFDTSTVTGTVSSATINIRGISNFDADVIVVPSTAFSGDGSTNLIGADINNLTFTTDYSDEYASWSTGNNAITLKSQAELDIQNNNYFICAVIQYDNDFLDSEPGSLVTLDAGIVWSTTAYLDFTETAAPSGYSQTVLGVQSSAYSKIIDVAKADIDAVNGVQ